MNSSNIISLSVPFWTTESITLVSSIEETVKFSVKSMRGFAMTKTMQAKAIMTAERIHLVSDAQKCKHLKERYYVSMESVNSYF
uniref:Uncharacterized protein n=1 Tax=Elaeophora elaphi TaxID=1147741 RepID=A0A0R3S600_9BILA